MRRPIVCGHPQLIRLLLDPDPAGAGGGGTGGTQAQDPPKGRERLPLSEEQVREIIKQEGTAERAFLKQDRRNRKHLAEANARAESAEKKLAEVSGKVPKDGSIVLSKDDAETWNKLQGLFKEGEIASIDDLAKQFKEGKTASDKLARAVRSAELNDVATDLAIPEDRRATFLKLAGDRKFAVEEVEESGKKIRKVFVVEGEGKEEKKIPAAEAFKDDAAALGIGTAAVLPARRPSAASARPSANTPAQAPNGIGQASGRYIVEDAPRESMSYI